MTFNFSIEKTLAATGFVMALEGGKCNLIKLIKILYFADRIALQSWHRTITGDKFFSMKNGPIVSTAYDLAKGTAPKKLQSLWDEYIGPRQHNTIPLIKMPDTDVLSEAEERILADAHAKISPMRTGQLIEWCHKFPEWSDPEGSSVRIDPKSVLRLTTVLTSKDIDAIEEEVDHSNFMATAFGA